MPPFEHGMGRDEHVARVCISRAAPRRIRHTVEVAADTDHAVARNPALEPQHRPERRQRQRAQIQPLLGERLIDDPARGRVQARVGDTVQPASELVIEVGQVAEAAREEKILADVAERSLDLSLGLGPCPFLRFCLSRSGPSIVSGPCVSEHLQGTICKLGEKSVVTCRELQQFHFHVHRCGAVHLLRDDVSRPNLGC